MSSLVSNPYHLKNWLSSERGLDRIHQKHFTNVAVERSEFQLKKKKQITRTAISAAADVPFCSFRQLRVARDAIHCWHSFVLKLRSGFTNTYIKLHLYCLSPVLEGLSMLVTSILFHPCQHHADNKIFDVASDPRFQIYCPIKMA